MWKFGRLSLDVYVYLLFHVSDLASCCLMISWWYLYELFSNMGIPRSRKSIYLSRYFYILLFRSHDTSKTWKIGTFEKTHDFLFPKICVKKTKMPHMFLISYAVSPRLKYIRGVMLKYSNFFNFSARFSQWQIFSTNRYTTTKVKTISSFARYMYLDLIIKTLVYWNYNNIDHISIPPCIALKGTKLLFDIVIIFIPISYNWYRESIIRFYCRLCLFLYDVSRVWIIPW